MFSSTAYEALYTYIGLHLHEASIKILTSYKFFAAIMIMVFALAFFFTAWRYFSRYFPGGLGSGGANLGKIVKIIACLFIGMTILKVDTQSSVTNYKKQSWHENSYVKDRRSQAIPTYRVSFLFDLLSRSAEEVSKFATEVVDHLFISTNSQLESPDYFYKAVMFAGTSTIDDPELKDKISYYTAECFDLVLPHIDNDREKDKIDRLFDRDGSVAPLLDKKTLRVTNGIPYTCLDLSEEVNQHLREFSRQKTGKMPTSHITNWGASPNMASRYDDKYLNLFASNALANHYRSQHERLLGIHEGSLPPGTTARVFQYLDRLISWDGFLSLIFQSDKHGAAQTAERSQEFSELLQRAPHIKGFTKMVLIALFPWLVFFIIAGRWKILIYWTALYGSVLLWEPIWTLCYHIITHIALSTEAMASFDRLGDGFSLYSAQIISSRMYYAYSIYSWVQILVGPLPTILLAVNMRSLLADAREESAPTIVNEVKSYATSGVSQPNPKQTSKD